MNRQAILAQITTLAIELKWPAQDMGRLKGQWAKKATLAQLVRVKEQLDAQLWAQAPTVTEWIEEPVRKSNVSNATVDRTRPTSLEWAADRALAQLRVMCRRVRRGAA